LVLVLAGLATADVVDMHYSAAVPYFVDNPTGNPGVAEDEYMWDDGTIDNSLGLTAGGAMGWWHCFTVIAGSETVSQVATAFGQMAAGGDFSVGVWSDPNNDCNPGDGALLAHTPNHPGGIVDPNTGFFNRVGIPATNVGAAGEKFFVVTWTSHAAGEFAAAMDSSGMQLNRAWVNGTNGGVHNPDVPPMTLGFMEITGLGFPYCFLQRGGADGAVTGCEYEVKKNSKMKKGCTKCYEKGDKIMSGEPCEKVKDCDRKIKEKTYECLEPEDPGFCKKLKAKRSDCIE